MLNLQIFTLFKLKTYERQRKHHLTGKNLSKLLVVHRENQYRGQQQTCKNVE